MEALGEAYIYQQHWTIVTRLENRNWKETIEFVKTCEETMTKLCIAKENFTGDGSCHHWEKDIEFLIHQIQERKEELEFFFNEHQATRRRRGWINAGGWVLNKVFGTMDADDAEEIYNRLKNLEINEEKQIDLMKKQLTLIKSNFEELTKPIQEIEREQNQMAARVNDLEIFIEQNSYNLSKSIKDNEFQNRINEIVTMILMRLNLIVQSQTNLFTVINSITQNKLHPLILKPSDIASISNRIHGYLENENPTLNYRSIKQVIKLESYPVENALLIKIQIPLPVKNVFELSKVYVTPKKLDENKYILIDTKVTYILNSKKTNETIKLESDELKDRCDIIKDLAGKNTYLCQYLNPRILHSEPDACDLTNPVITKNQTEAVQCPYRILVGKQELLISLVRKNSWFFMLEEARVFQATCEKETKQINLIGEGIIKLFIKCTFTLGNLLLPFETDVDETLPITQPETLLNIFPNISIGELQTVNIGQRNRSTLNIVNHSKYLNIFEKSSNSIKEMEQEVKDLENKRKHDQNKITQSIQWGISGTMFMIILIFAILKCHKKRTIYLSKIQKGTKSRNNPNPIIEISSPILPKRNKISTSLIDQPYEEPIKSPMVPTKVTFDKPESTHTVGIEVNTSNNTIQPFKRESTRLTAPKMNQFKFT